MYKPISVVPNNLSNITEEQKKVVTDIAISMNQALLNIQELYDLLGTNTNIGVLNLYTKIEQILLAINVTNTIDPVIYNIREQSIGPREFPSLADHSLRIFNNESTWASNYGSLGYYLLFLKGNATFLNPSEQSHYSCLAFLSLYANYKDLSLAINDSSVSADNFIYNYPANIIRSVDKLLVMYRHLRVLPGYELSKYGEPFLLTKFTDDLPKQLLFQTLPKNYIPFLKAVYNALSLEELEDLALEIPLQEISIDPDKIIYDYNEALIGPSGLNSLTTLVGATLLRRAHYLIFENFNKNRERIEDLIVKGISVLNYSPITFKLANQIKSITDKPLEEYDTKFR